jgi:hypothetical protein
MPDLNKLIRQMRGAKVFSVLDLKSGYWQVPLNNPNARKYSAFRTGGYTNSEYYPSVSKIVP